MSKQNDHRLNTESQVAIANEKHSVKHAPLVTGLRCPLCKRGSVTHTCVRLALFSWLDAIGHDMSLQRIYYMNYIHRL